MLSAVIVDDLSKVKVCYQIAADDHKGRIQMLSGIPDRTGRAIVFVRQCIGDFDPPVTAVSKMLLNHFRFEIEQNDDFIDAAALEFIDDMFHHRDIDDREHRFGDRVGEWLNTCTKTAGHQNGFDIVR